MPFRFSIAYADELNDLHMRSLRTFRHDAVVSTSTTLGRGAHARVTVRPLSALLLLSLDDGNKDTHTMKQLITTINGNKSNINHQHQIHTNNESINIMIKTKTQKDARMMAFKASEEMPSFIVAFCWEFERT